MKKERMRGRVLTKGVRLRIAWLAWRGNRRWSEKGKVREPMKLCATVRRFYTISIVIGTFLSVSQLFAIIRPVSKQIYTTDVFMQFGWEEEAWLTGSSTTGLPFSIRVFLWWIHFLTVLETWQGWSLKFWKVGGVWGGGGSAEFERADGNLDYGMDNRCTCFIYSSIDSIESDLWNRFVWLCTFVWQ